MPQYRWLSRDYEDVQKLRYAYISKAIIATALIFLAFAFAIGIYTNVDVGSQPSKSKARDSHGHVHSPPAVFEWIIAIGYTLYLLTLWYDLRLFKRVNKGDLALKR